MHFAIYSRKSIATGKGESIENQIEMCRNYIASKFNNGTAHDITIYEDEGFSGKNSNRPRFKQLKRDIAAKKMDYVICYRLDRISRNVSDFASLIEELNSRNIHFICIREEFDTSKPMGKAMMYIASVFAQLERETIAERVRDNMLMLARTGRWLGGTTPTGFVSERIQDIIMDGRLRISYQLKAVPEEVDVVRLMGDMLLELRSISGVSKFLIRQGIQTRNGNYYCRQGIKDILTNPVYCIADCEARNYYVDNQADVCFEEEHCSSCYGLISYNKRNYRKNEAHRQGIEEWIIAVGKHSGIFSGKEWIAIQNILREKSTVSIKKVQNDYSLLSGRIQCQNCGGHLYAKGHSSRKMTGHFYYICQNKLHGGNSLCSIKNLNGKQTDQVILGRILEQISVDKDILTKLYKLKQSFGYDNVKVVPDDSRSRCHEIQNEIDKLMDSIRYSSLNEEFIRRVNDRITYLDYELKDVEKQKGKVMEPFNIEGARDDKNIHSSIVNHIEIEKAAACLMSLSSAREILTLEEKRELIDLFLSSVIWDGEELIVTVQ